MTETSSFHYPLPGETRVYYCSFCNKNFSAKVPKENILSLFTRTRSYAKCPNCKRKCGLDPRIQY